MKCSLILLLSLASLSAQSPTPPPSATPIPKPLPPGYPSPTPRETLANPPEGITRISLPSGGKWTPGPTEMERDPDAPSLDLYLVKSDKPTTAIIIFPGGGYQSLAMSWEGAFNARFRNKFGVSVFILRYRHFPRFRHPGPLEDAQLAIRYVRSRAAEYNIVPDRIGILGCSAGGHLASTAVTRFDNGDPQSADPLARLSSRPDFALLLYPVITFTVEQYVHKDSRTRLTADDPDLKQALSTELHVRADTPPVFLLCGGQDTTVPPENAILFYQACRAAKVPAELHIFEQGIHGLRDPLDMVWHDIAGNWLYRNGWIEKPPITWSPDLKVL